MTGCSYTGSIGGAIVIDTENCANDGAGIASVTSPNSSGANNSERTKRILRISDPPESIFLLCGKREQMGRSNMLDVIKKLRLAEISPTCPT
jgi:hypothetical protein